MATIENKGLEPDEFWHWTQSLVNWKVLTAFQIMGDYWKQISFPQKTEREETVLHYPKKVYSVFD
jgi:hypothetical protein